MGINAFSKTGNTVTFTASTSAPTPVQCASTTLGGNQYRIINAGTSIVFLGYGSTAANATANAVQVTSTQGAFPLLPSTDEILTFMPNAYFTGVTATGSAVVYITPGDGV
jgi:predicted ABC-class ATPase